MGNSRRIIPPISFIETLAWLMGRRFRFTVQGHSMEPTLHSGQVVLLRTPSQKHPIQVGDVVVFSHDHKQYIKRVETIQNGELIVQGDNSGHSKEFDLLPHTAINGIVTCVI